MNLIVVPALLALLPVVAQGQERDRLASPECRAARAELEQALNDPSTGRSLPRGRLDRARERAAATCLGGTDSTDGKRERSGAPQPVQVVPAPRITPQLPPHLPPAAPPRAALPIPRPAAITACDPAGCWDSEGRRLNHMGPALMGPQGPCTVQGGFVSCP